MATAAPARRWPRRRPAAPSQVYSLKLRSSSVPDIRHDADLEVGTVLRRDRERAGQDAGRCDGQRQGCGGEPAHALLLCVGRRDGASPARILPPSTTRWDGHAPHRSGFAVPPEALRQRRPPGPRRVRASTRRRCPVDGPRTPRRSVARHADLVDAGLDGRVGASSTATSSMATRCPARPSGSGAARPRHAGSRRVAVAGDRRGAWPGGRRPRPRGARAARRPARRRPRGRPSSAAAAWPGRRRAPGRAASGPWSCPPSTSCPGARPVTRTAGPETARPSCRPARGGVAALPSARRRASSVPSGSTRQPRSISRSSKNGPQFSRAGARAQGRVRDSRPCP